jgi:negative regulator of the PHO system
MYTGKPLFPGKDNDDQLLRIFKLMGTPSEQTWPRVSEYSEYKPNFPVYPPLDIRTRVPMNDAYGLDILSRTLQYQPSLRISAKNALHHLYFRDILVQGTMQNTAQQFAGMDMHGHGVPQQQQFQQHPMQQQQQQQQQQQGYAMHASQQLLQSQTHQSMPQLQNNQMMPPGMPPGMQQNQNSHYQ